MSLLESCVQFDAGKQVEHWQDIAQGLCDGEVGVKLQERVDAFGEKPTELLENLLEEHGGVLLHASGWELSGTQVSLHFEWPADIESFVQDLNEFLLSCGVESLVIKANDLSGD
jgi:hypothetical protein